MRRDQDRPAWLFGGETGDHADKSTEVSWRAGPGGLPILDKVPAWFAGRVENRIDGGDHIGSLPTPEAADELTVRDTPVPTLNDTHDTWATCRRVSRSRSREPTAT
ncbi:flavin reductase [Streptomyces sp. NPDC058296]|uniref:flavin reductase n=1 Tax=Streptomyces sp. NPDC058296 TaxID=3346432 RepID=UPI0036E8F82D